MKKKIALLVGGISSEAYLSRRSCEVLLAELDRDKFDIFVLDWQKDGALVESEVNSPDRARVIHRSILDCFARFRGDAVVNLTHGEKENSGQLQGLFELAGIPFTGNDLESSVIGMDKILTKQCFRVLGVSCLPEMFLQPGLAGNPASLLEGVRGCGLRFPLICKPVKGGSSEGIALVRSGEELLAFLATGYGSEPYMLEEFIRGYDYSVGVFALKSGPEPILFPTARIAYTGDFFDAAIKYDDTYRVEFPADIAPELDQSMRRAALRIHESFGFNGFSRTDFIVRGEEYFALEVNTHPGMSSFSIVPNMVKQTEYTLGGLFEKMIEQALQGRC